MISWSREDFRVFPGATPEKIGKRILEHANQQPCMITYAFQFDVNRTVKNGKVPLTHSEPCNWTS